jgi:hypothetical protein
MAATTEGRGLLSGMVTVLPGTHATAGVFGDDPGDEHLVMLLDPFTLALTLPTNRDAWVHTARFLRELAHSAGLLADRIDPDAVGQPSWALEGGATP